MTQKISKKREKIEKALALFISSYNLNLDIKYIKDLIYNSDKKWLVLDGKKYMQFRMDIFDEYKIDFSQNLIDLLSDCWNYFPHKELDGKCPTELFESEYWVKIS